MVWRCRARSGGYEEEDKSLRIDATKPQTSADCRCSAIAHCLSPRVGLPGWPVSSSLPLGRLSSCSNMDTLSADDAFDEAAQQVARRVQEIEERLLAEELERDTIKEVYGDAWQRFYEWEHRHCRSLLQGFRCAPSQVDNDSNEAAIPLSGGEDVMEVDDYPFRILDSGTGLVTMLDVEEIDTTPRAFAPHPKYEACTPSCQIIATDHSPSWLAFIFYADEPGFPWRKFIRYYRHWEWQDCVRDPDGMLLSSVWVSRDVSLLIQLVSLYWRS